MSEAPTNPSGEFDPRQLEAMRAIQARADQIVHAEVAPSSVRARVAEYATRLEHTIGKHPLYIGKLVLAGSGLHPSPYGEWTLEKITRPEGSVSYTPTTSPDHTGNTRVLFAPTWQEHTLYPYTISKATLLDGNKEPSFRFATMAVPGQPAHEAQITIGRAMTGKELIFSRKQGKLQLPTNYKTKEATLQVSRYDEASHTMRYQYPQLGERLASMFDDLTTILRDGLLLHNTLSSRHSIPRAETRGLFEYQRLHKTDGARLSIVSQQCLLGMEVVLNVCDGKCTLTFTEMTEHKGRRIPKVLSSGVITYSGPSGKEEIATLRTALDLPLYNNDTRAMRDLLSMCKIRSRNLVPPPQQ